MAYERSSALMIKLLFLLVLAPVATACPYPCICTEFKVDCYDKGLTEIPDNFPPDVISIDLQYNHIDHIGNQFHNLTSLEEVMLRFNRISHVADGAFSDLPNLNHINLGSNVISNLSGSAFHNVSQMSILDLTDNHLSSVDSSFQGLSSLTKLVLTRNLIEQITENSLKSLTSLIYFMADENHIAHVHPDAFSSLAELSFVSLIKNPLDSMDNVFSKNDMLSFLSLDDCQLTNVPKGLPWATRNLQLRRNNISSISKDTFMSTRFLGVIMLDDNRIAHVEDEAFTPIAHLQELRLSGNHLSTLPSPIPSTAHTLSIDNNDITSLSNDDFPHDSQMKTLSLRGNQINTINPFTFSRLTSLQKLYLSDNAITELQDKSFFGLRNLTELEISKNPIMHIDVRFAAGLHKLDVLDLSYVDDSEPFMRGNFFRDIPFLKTLLLRFSPSLASNILTSNETLMSFYNLKELDVRDNSLQSLEVDLARFFPSLQTLGLAGNAWLCDARLLWLHDWMQTSRPIFHNVEQVRCATPRHLAGAVIADLPFHAFFYTTTTAPTTVESAESGDADEKSETDSGEAVEITTITRYINHSSTESSGSELPDNVHPQTTANVPTTERRTEEGEVPDEVYTTSQMGDDHVTTSVVVTTSTSDQDDDINNTGDRSSRVKGHTTATTARMTTSTVSSEKHTQTESAITSTLPTTTSPAPASNATNTTTTTTPQPQMTDMPKDAETKTQSDANSSFTLNIIIATSVVVVTIIIAVVAMVPIMRNKGKIRLLLYRTLTPSTPMGDTELVLSDQDEPDSRSDCNAVTQLSGSEQGSSPSVETASDDGLCTRLV